MKEGEKIHNGKSKDVDWTYVMYQKFITMIPP